MKRRIRTEATFYNPHAGRYETAPKMEDLIESYFELQRLKESPSPQHKVSRFQSQNSAETTETYEKETPIRPATLESEVYVPLFQSFITGLLSFPVWGAITRWAGGDVLIAIALTCFTSALWWLNTVSDARSLLRIRERIESTPDPPKELIVAAPAQQLESSKQPETVRIRLYHGENKDKVKRVQLLEISSQIENKLPDVARLVLVGGVSFSRPQLATKHRVLSQSEFNALKSTMVKAGLAVALPNNSTELVGAGRAFLQHYLE